MPSLPTLFPALFLKKRWFLVSLVLSCICIAPTYGQDKATAQLRDSIIMLKKSSGNSLENPVYIDLLNNLAYELRYYQVDSTYSLANEALQLSRKADYKKGESHALLRLGDYYSDKGESDHAIKHYSESLDLATGMEDQLLALRIMNNLASEYTYKGDFAKALNGYLDGIEMAKDNPQARQLLSIINENIANLFASQKDYEQSLDFYKQVKKINVDLGDPVSMAETGSNLASVYADIGEMDYAMFNINSSITFFEKEKIMDWLAYAYEIKGKIYLKQHNYKWALHWYNQSELIHENIEDDRGKIDLYNGMAEAYLAQGRDSLSKKYALEAYDISDRIKFAEGKQKCASTLYTIYKNSGDFEKALAYNELSQRISDTLHRIENKKSLVLIKTKSEYDKQKSALIEANEKAMAKQKRYIYASLSVLVVLLLIIFLVQRNQKIQKRLNGVLKAQKELLEKREEELQENNQTKTKLFSIIGHDLRGPIGALQGLLTMFSEGDISKSEFLDFLPKLRGDVDHINFTLNNLLSWGQSQMNGSVTKPEVTSLEAIVEENINLLSEIAKKKSIKIISELQENTLTWADSNQIDIVIRNLISNALKFTPENGMIKIEGYELSKHWQISVRDTGVGMDQETVDKLFDKNSNVTTYGTNNEKGTGLGLSLCKEMVEKNKGTIWVESTLRKGSTFFFTLPIAQKKYTKAS